MLLGIGIISLFGSVILAAVTSWLFTERNEIGIFTFFFCIFLVPISAILLILSGVSEVGSEWYLKEDVIYRVIGRTEIQESTILVLEEGDGNLICVKVSEPPPEDARYIKKKEERSSKATLVVPDEVTSKKEQ